MKINKVMFKKMNGESRIMRFIYLRDLPDGFLYANYYLPRMMKKRIEESKYGRHVDIKSQEEAQKILLQEERTLPEGQKRVWDLDKNDFRILNENTIINKMMSYEEQNDRDLLDEIKQHLTKNV